MMAPTTAQCERISCYVRGPCGVFLLVASPFITIGGNVGMPGNSEELREDIRRLGAEGGGTGDPTADAMLRKWVPHLF